MPDFHAPDASSLLRQAIRGSELSLNHISRETGVARQQLRAFIEEQSSLRLDVADRVFTYLLSNISGSLIERDCTMIRTIPLPDVNSEGIDDLRYLENVIDDALQGFRFKKVRREGSLSWNYLPPTRRANKTLFKLARVRVGEWFFGARHEFARHVTTDGRQVLQFVPAAVGFLGQRVSYGQANVIRNLIEEVLRPPPPT